MCMFCINRARLGFNFRVVSSVTLYILRRHAIGVKKNITPMHDDQDLHTVITDVNEQVNLDWAQAQNPVHVKRQAH